MRLAKADSEPPTFSAMAMAASLPDCTMMPLRSSSTFARVPTGAPEERAEALRIERWFDEALAHAVEAGADLFLMPSRFEPCGLNQMYSQRYGTPPIVRRTGGLADTVEDGLTGFLFEKAESESLLAAVRRALAAYADLPRWRAMQRAAMARDFSWRAAARRYADLYRRLATPPTR